MSSGGIRTLTGLLSAARVACPFAVADFQRVSEVFALTTRLTAQPKV